MIKREVSVVIPAYNEEAHIGETLQEVSCFLRESEWTHEIIVVNDGSLDGTAEVVFELSREIPEIVFLNRQENKGKGETVKEGITLARYAYSLFMDADNSTSIREWGKFVPCFEEGYQVVVGSRHLPESLILQPQPLSRKILGAGYRSLSRFLFGLNGRTDFNCGFKAFETDLAKAVFSKIEMQDWTFDVELFCLLKREDARIAEVPIQWVHREKKSASIVPVKTAFRCLGSLIDLKRRF